MSLSRAQIRSLKKIVREKLDGSAAELLLVDSINKRHDKLALHRYLILRGVDLRRCEPYEPYCEQVAKQLTEGALHRIARHVYSQFPQFDNGAKHDAPGHQRVCGG